jgi:hypothetical protein
MTSPSISTAASSEEAPLVFQWGPLQGEKFLISVFLISSLLLHALAFYMFRIIYPPAIAVLPPPARVSVIAPNTEEGRTLLRWIEAEDPALATATVRPPETRARALPKLAHVPSYIVQEPQLKEAPPLELVPNPPTAFPPGPLPVPTNSAEAAWPRTPTRVLFSDEIKPLGPIKLSPPQFISSTGEPPENIRFRVAVNNQGEIRYCFPLNFSGDPTLDEQARLWLIRSRLQSAPVANNPDTLRWGIATIEWGNDVSPPPRNSAPSSR